MDNLKYFKYFFDYMRDGNYPFWEKFLILLGLAYIVIPLDFIPDFLLPVGILDDSVVLGAILLSGGKILKNYFEKTVEQRLKEVKTKQRAKTDSFKKTDAIDVQPIELKETDKANKEEW